MESRETKIRSKDNTFDFAKSYYAFDQMYDSRQVEENDEFFVEASVPGFQQLVKSTGSEILPSDVQTLIDKGPDEFLEKHGESTMEKIAMISITEQLPQKAVQALQTTRKKKNSSAKSKKNDLLFAKDKRVSPEEEIALARTIKKGAALYKIRTDALEKGKELTHKEWADLAGLTSKELRRQVATYRRAKHDLVVANLGLVHAVVNQLWSTRYSRTGVTKQELVQEGSLGLLRAAELFDPERGLRFSTYAVVWIKGTLSNSHVPDCEIVRLPLREKNKWSKILKAQKDILCMSDTSKEQMSSLDICVPVEEIAAQTGLTVAEILSTQRKMKQAKRVFSLDHTIKGQSRSGADNGSEETLESRHSIEERDLADRTQMHADILAAMARNLDVREGRLMRLRYGLTDGRARTLHECADAMGLSYTRVNQLAKQCLKKLREAAEAESLEEYLLTIS
jgi:RNA polymerase primary sigma factor